MGDGPLDFATSAQLQRGEEMRPVSVYPWIAGPVVAGEGLLHFVKNMTPMGVLSVFFVDGVRRYGIPVLVGVPSTLLFGCALMVSRLRRDAPASALPFEEEGGGR